MSDSDGRASSRMSNAVAVRSIATSSNRPYPKSTSITCTRSTIPIAANGSITKTTSRRARVTRSR